MQALTSFGLCVKTGMASVLGSSQASTSGRECASSVGMRVIKFRSKKTSGSRASAASCWVCGCGSGEVFVGTGSGGRIERVRPFNRTRVISRALWRNLPIVSTASIIAEIEDSEEVVDESRVERRSSLEFHRRFYEVSYARDKIENVKKLADEAAKATKELLDLTSSLNAPAVGTGASVVPRQIRRSKVFSTVKRKKQLDWNHLVEFKAQDETTSSDAHGLVESKRQTRQSTKSATSGKQNLPAPPRQSKTGNKKIDQLFKSNTKGSLLTAAEEKVIAAKVQDLTKLEELYRTLTKDLGREPKTEEWANAAECTAIELNDRIKRGQYAKRKMVDKNMRLVISIAKRYQRNGVSLDDLIAEGIFGLIRGVEKFDPDRGFKFSTYAHWWIRQAVSRSISDQSRVIRVPVHMYELYSKATRKKSDLRCKLGREPSHAELAEVLGIQEKKLQRMYRALKHPLQLDAPPGPNAEGDQLSDLVEDHSVIDPEANAIEGCMKSDLENVLDTLNERERGILRLRYGLDDGVERTLEEVGRSFKVTRERVRQIEAKAIRKLRHPGRCAMLLEYAKGLRTEVRRVSSQSSRRQ